MEKKEWEKKEEYKPEQTVFSRSHADIKEGGKKMCEKHVWKKLSDNEVYCILCPTALIVNREVLDSLLK